jgi:hypothetical protein
MFDGEGHHSGGLLGICQKPGAVWDKLCNSLSDIDIVFDGRSEAGVERLRILGGLAQRTKFLGEIQPVRLINNFREQLWGKTIQAIEYDRVVDVRPIGTQEVVMLETSTGTFLQEGFGSHNCYGLIYGMGERKYADSVGISLGEAKEIRSRFFSSFPGVQEYMRATIRDAEKLRPHPHAYTAFGRKVACDSGYEYKLSNYRIQGTAADQTKLAVAAIIDAGLVEFLRFVVHDEVVLEVCEEDAPVIAKQVEELMAKAGENVLSVPSVAEAKIAYSFGAFKEK